MSIEVPTLGGRAGHEQPREEPLRFVVETLIRHWLKMLIGVLCGLVAGLIFSFSGTPSSTRWEAHTELLVQQSLWEHSALKVQGSLSLVPTRPKAIVQRVSRQQLAENVTRALIQQDIENGGSLGSIVFEDELNTEIMRIGALISVEGNDETGTITVAAYGDSREEVVRLAEATARVFIDSVQMQRLEEVQELSDHVRKEVEKLRQQLDQQESEEWEFRKSMGFRMPEQVMQEMNGLNDELASMTTGREEILGKLEEINAELDANSALLPASLGNVSEAVVKNLMEELDTLREEQLSLSIQWQPGQGPLAELEASISEKEQAILVAVNKLKQGSGGSALWEKRQNLYRQKLDLELKQTSHDIRISTIKKILDEKVEKLPDLANKGFTHERITHNTTRTRDQFYELMSKDFEIRSKIDQGSGQIERQTPVHASIPFGRGLVLFRVASNLLVGAAVGFLAAFALSIVLEKNDTSIRSIEDVTKYLNIDVIGTIPKMQFGAPRGRAKRRSTHVALVDEAQIDACIVTQHDPKSPVSEAYRTLRTNFQLATFRKKPRTVMVTSAVPAEGKTTTAVNFAVTMADCGVRVLVIDTDLRRPNVHRVLKMERGTGLADILREGLPLESVIRSTRIENLSIISSGRVPPNPSELIGSKRMQDVMKELASRFELVICDAPSIHVVTDPVLLALNVDTVMLVVTANNARRETIIRARKMLETAHVDFAGVVLNAIEATRRHYYYYYYYYDDVAGREERGWRGLF